MLRRTKIIATLGPATDDEPAIEKLIRAGIDMVRINFSHGELADHENQVSTVRKYAASLSRAVGILGDLQGPKIRIARFQKGSVTLEPGQKFVLDAGPEASEGCQECVGVDYKQLPADVKPGDLLLLDDGRIELQVDNVENSKVICTVKTGGKLSNNKGINRKGGGLSAVALTDKDLDDLKAAAAMQLDYVAVSFVRHAADIKLTRKILDEFNATAGIIAKIERAEAIDAVDNIIQASDGVMIARGDLGVEIGDAEVPAIQKRIIERARSLDKPVITATQMMESMIQSPLPTRAEVSDVANAVIDGTDAVMLSGETAVGRHPEKVVIAAARVCLAAERQPVTRISRHRVDCRFKRVDEAISMSAMYAANHLDIKAILALTESGSTPLWMSRIRTAIPIFGLSRHSQSLGRMTLYRNVYPLHFDVTAYQRDEIKRKAIDILEQRGVLNPGDMAIITKGDQDGVYGMTNAMKIVEVGHVV
ncbi:pyruvate kinase [Alkalispirochaeta odontotermitis]|nr:pyruvate kinase [Alkalispirochaeta odontotermitis]CAB1083979.1 Pyruvate kinase (EC [Olavius algarvensis Delta 1 endosymbiont]